MQFWRRSIQWQLILSMGTALLVSILIVVAIYTLIVNRLSQQYLLDTALPASIEATRNDIERILVQPLTAAKDIAGNPMVRQWLAEGENSAQTPQFIAYLNAVQNDHQAFSAFIISAATQHYYTQKGTERTLSRNDAKDAWFYSFMDSGKPRILAIDTDLTTGELALFMNE
jgi:methyl-accepting chemotaxis protein